MNDGKNMEKKDDNTLKFSLELDENGDVLINVKGHPIDIAKKLFLPFFENTGMKGKLIANTICTAIKLAYPKESKKIFINNT